MSDESEDESKIRIEHSFNFTPSIAIEKPNITINEPIKQIFTIDELFEFFGFKIDSESNEELSLKQYSSDQILKIPKQIFSDF